MIFIGNQNVQPQIIMRMFSILYYLNHHLEPIHVNSILLDLCLYRILNYYSQWTMCDVPTATLLDFSEITNGRHH